MERRVKMSLLAAPPCPAAPGPAPGRVHPPAHPRAPRRQTKTLSFAVVGGAEGAPWMHKHGQEGRPPESLPKPLSDK